MRPVREQLEHDRIIRLLHAKVPPEVRSRDEPRRRAERAGRHRPDRAVSRPRAAVAGSRPPLQAIVEVETGESVNHLEALAQWAHYGRAARGVSPLRARRDGRRRAPAEPRTTRSTSPKSGAITSSATSRASRWCTATARRSQRSAREAAAGRSRADAPSRRADAPSRRQPSSQAALPRQSAAKPAPKPKAKPAPKPKPKPKPKAKASPRPRRRAKSRKEEVGGVPRSSRATSAASRISLSSSRPRTGAAKCGRACCTGFARRPTSRSAASRSTPRVRRALEAQNPDVDIRLARDRRDADSVRRRGQVARAPPRERAAKHAAAEEESAEAAAASLTPRSGADSQRRSSAEAAAVAERPERVSDDVSTGRRTGRAERDARSRATAIATPTASAHSGAAVDSATQGPRRSHAVNAAEPSGD